MAIRIRSLRLPDYPTMIELFQTCGLNPKTHGRDSRPSIARQLRANRDLYLGAFDGRRLVGTVLGTHDTRKGWINRLAVDPHYRRRGIARRLVRECERRLRKRGLEMFAALIETDNVSSAVAFRTFGYEILPMLYARRKLRRTV